VRNARQDLLGRVHEVEDVGGVLTRVGAVQARERLHRLDAGEAPIDIHAAEKRLIEAGLELVGDKQQVVVGAGECLTDVTSLEPRV
jgi:hypothetical protein